MLLVVAGFAMASPAEAKYTYTFAGHSAVYYTNSDIVQWLRPYIDHIELDTVSQPGVGARLYFTNQGKYAAKYDSGAVPMAKYVMSLPEWTPSRSQKSVSEEIKYHAWWPGRMSVDIEYFCSDLKSWEVYRVYC